MRVLVVVIAFLLLVFSGYTFGTDEDIWNDANMSYDQNDFRSAIKGYRTLLEHNVRSSEVYYNLGCSYFKNDQLGMAIAAFRHSLKLDPSYKPAQQNLDFVRKYTIDKVEQKPKGFILNIWYGVTGLLSAEGFFIFSVIAYWGLCLVITVMILGFSHKEFLTYLLILLIIIFILGTVITNFAIDESVNTRWGVITIATAELREGPGEDFDKIFTGHEGLEFKILSRRQGYYLVELANGLRGWIENVTLTEI